MTKSRFYLILAGIVTVFIFSASSQTAQESSELSQGLLHFLMLFLGKIGITITHLFVRKAAHFTEFFMQSLFLSLSAFYSLKGLKPYISNIVLTGLLTACLDEFSQHFSLGRSAQISDVLIDFSGTMCALILLCVVEKLSKRRA
ncbi:MAG: VanZ family protein [Eubacteriales bacterium]|nr:VanZ family protein [Eubacteriales bacterium]